MMHSLLLRKNFIAQHFLIGKDFGAENDKHSHHYSFEVEIESADLDEYNYLIDINDIKAHLDGLISEYNDKTLNELSEFQGENPSLELFSKILWNKCRHALALPSNCKLTVRLWEDTIAQASYRDA